MDRKDFFALLKDLLPRLYDYAALEDHPLTAVVAPPEDHDGSRGEYLQKLVLAAIEKLRPGSGSLNLTAVEWRPYLILYKRYVEGAGPQDLAVDMALSERQVRRDHNRALEGLAARMWNEIFRHTDPLTPLEYPPGDPGYPIQPELLDLNRILHDLAAMLQKRLAHEDVSLTTLPFGVQPPAVLVLADRTLARQTLIGLFNYVLHLNAGAELRLSASQEGAASYEFQVDEDWDFWRQQLQAEMLGPVANWLERLEARLDERFPPSGRAGDASVRVQFMAATPGQSVLVIDDQQPALRMFQRYLSQTPYKVVGVTDPKEAVETARQVQPEAITLDVMMPQVDGWEILQALKLDPETRSIPVIICSAWEEPELAESLGAAAFLKKPVTQRDLLSAIERVTKG